MKILTIWVVCFCIIFPKLGIGAFMVDVDTSIIVESFWEGFSLVFETIKPFIYSFFVGAVIVYFIKLIGGKLIEFVYIGCSKREIKRKRKGLTKQLTSYQHYLIFYQKIKKDIS